MSEFNDQILTQELTEHRGDTEFDWDELETRLGELRADGQQISEQEMKRLALALHAILNWMMTANLSHKHGLKAVGMRTVAAAWVLDPARFGENASLRSLSRMLGFNAANISPLTAEFSRLFAVFNKFQNHDWRKDRKHNGNDQNKN